MAFHHLSLARVMLQAVAVLLAQPRCCAVASLHQLGRSSSSPAVETAPAAASKGLTHRSREEPQGAELCDLDLYYGEGFLDICHHGRSYRNQARPLIMLIHGAKTSKTTMQSEWGTMLYNHGFVVASIGYEVASCPSNLAAATTWLRTNAMNFGADANRMGYFGASWGGSCAAIVGLTVPMPGLRAMALVSASVPVPANSILQNRPISVLLMQSKYDQFVNLNRSQDTYRMLRSVGMDTHKIRYNEASTRILNIGDDPLLKLNDFFLRVFGRP